MTLHDQALMHGAWVLIDQPYDPDRWSMMLNHLQTDLCPHVTHANHLIAKLAEQILRAGSTREIERMVAVTNIRAALSAIHLSRFSAALDAIGASNAA